MAANGITGTRDHHEAFLVSHTNTLFKEHMKVKLPGCCSPRILNRKTHGKEHPGYRLETSQHSLQLVGNVRGVK